MPPYHHGDLRRAVLAAAVDAITEHGPAGISLRDLARRVGVSHAGPVHHFKDKAGVLTALAAEGFALLADTLTDTRGRTGSFAELGVSYVRFAVEHKAHFEVMFRPDLHHPDDPDLTAARERAGAALAGGVADVEGERTGPDRRVAGVAAWSLVHGFATLWNTGNLDPGPDGDPLALARKVTPLLFEE
ncbi:transcriptional regulator, TetR family [Lentzea fradiae]|uniref:Transcriptional regulator, TetR family n=1 Tax=Lentzea fradiae TaxID=200378 RepID=A0A1G7KYW6_9PSEU|nr:TetR/AcrR family transcriptional regulator [Lentzea fradiae]SDF42050.1 transcriptional regulator, TetR family [Lentzea fradiae]